MIRIIPRGEKFSAEFLRELEVRALFSCFTTGSLIMCAANFARERFFFRGVKRQNLRVSKVWW